MNISWFCCNNRLEQDTNDKILNLPTDFKRIKINTDAFLAVLRQL